MKIAFIYDVIYPETIGGVEKRIYELGTRLTLMGHEVHLYGMKYWEGPDIIVRDGLIIHGVCQAMGLYKKGRRSFFQAMRYTAGLIPHLFKIDADVIDCQNFPYFPAIVTFLISKFKKKPLVITWHEFWGNYWYAYLGMTGCIGLLIERLALLSSPQVIAVSLHTANQMKLAGYSGEIDVIPNGISLAKIAAVPMKEERTDIIFVARFIPEKHPELVVEAVHQLIQKGIMVRCIMVGDGPEFSAVQKLIQSYCLDEYITCTGFIENQEDVISLMKSSKIFIFPSEREGFGIAAVEAMACGLSLVTVNHPRNAASAHIIPGGGYLAELSAADIASGIIYCLNTPPDLVAISRYAMRHDWDKIADDLEKYYLSQLPPGTLTLTNQGIFTGSDLT
jgi:glycosyltransferase involved in cell wall biosynthesis